MNRGLWLSSAAALLVAASACTGSEMPGRVASETPRTAVAADSSLADRAVHTATSLNDEVTLVAGGCAVDGCVSATRSAVLVSADGDRPVDAMGVARDGHTATLLEDGRVLVVGGFTAEGQPPLSSAEVYAPDTDRWIRVGSTSTGRGGHAAARLGDGRVLVAGGWLESGRYTATTEIFDPVSERFTPGPRLPRGLDGLAAASLTDGSVLVAGGQPSPGLATDLAVLIAPDGSSSRRVGALSSARFKHALVSLPSGEVLVIGGTSDDTELLASTEVFDPRTRSFSPGPTMSSGRYKLSGGASLLPDGRVLVAGGGPGVEVIDVQAGTSEPLASAPPVRSSFSTVSVVADTVRVVGGYDEGIALTGTNLRIPLPSL